MSEPLSLDVRDVTVAYPNGNVALHDATFRLAAGTICALVGVNGSGKSTLFKAVMGFVKPVRGTVSLGGLSLREAQRRNLVAYVPQAEEVDWTFPVSVWDVVMMGRYGRMNLLRWPAPEDRRAVREALGRVELTDLAPMPVATLSGGQRKRTLLARAIAQQARLLLLDEPFTGVDRRTEGLIIEQLRRFRSEGGSALIATHDLEAIPTFCDRVLLLNRRVLASGPTAEVFTQANLLRTFGASPERTP